MDYKKFLNTPIYDYKPKPDKNPKALITRIKPKKPMMK